VATAAELERQVQKFQNDNPWIFDLIGYFNEAPEIPWGHVGVRSDYLSYLFGSYDKARVAYDSLDFRPEAVSSKEATEAAKRMFDQTKGFWDKAQAAGSIAWETFSGGGMDVVADVLVVFVGTSFKHLEYGYNLHVSGAARELLKTTEQRVSEQIRRGQISRQKGLQLIGDTEKALQYHASSVKDGLAAIGYLDSKGFLNSAKRAANGLGALGGAVISILGIAAIAAAALVIVAMYQISTVNKIIAEQCSTFRDEKARLACTKAALERLPQWDMAAIAGSLIKWLVLGGLAVGAVVFLPTIARSVFRSRAVIRKELRTT